MSIGARGSDKQPFCRICMNTFLKPNLKYIKGRHPEFNEAVLKNRLKNIYWPVWKRPCVCEVTVNYACNSRCRFCYNRLSPAKGSTEPDFKTAARVLAEGRKRGAWLAVIIGGEPTLREDICRLAALAVKLGYPCVKLCTNGLRLADRTYAGRLVDSGFNMIDISLHGVRPEIHDTLVGVPGAFLKVMRAMENVRALKAELGTNHVVNRLNYKTFPEFFRFALLELGINYFNIIYSNYRGEMARNAAGLKVKISLAAPYIARGLAAYKLGAAPALSGILVNFPPCIMPGFQHLSADWKLSSAQQDETLMLPDGRSVSMHLMKDKQKLKPRACAACVFFGRCRGIDREYLEIFGAGEFVPLKREPPLSEIRSLL